MNKLVSIEELKQQIWNIEGIQVDIKQTGNIKRLVRSYDYERLPDYATVDDLRKRISKCLEPFIYFILPNN